MSPESLLQNLGRKSGSRRTRLAAFTVAVCFVVIAAGSLTLDSRTAPELTVFVPMCATLWILAQSLTALLLFGQFYITGSVGFLVIAIAYEFAALLSLPYLLSIPEVIPGLILTRADHQLTGAFWATWHLGFAASMAVAFTLDPTFRKRIATRATTGRVLAIAAFATFAATLVLGALVWLFRSHLPLVVVASHPTNYYRFVLAPLVAVVNLTACAFILWRGRPQTSLGIWIALATFAAALDAALNAASSHRFSAPWYLAKVETTLTTSLVLFMLAFQIASLYRHLAYLATTDALTGLRNRRGLDEHIRRLFEVANDRPVALTMLLVDIDLFKNYNDLYGHVRGDATLQRVATIVQQSVRKRYDLAVRYGGEEFVVVLHDVALHDAVEASQRLQSRLKAELIPHAAMDGGFLTVSIGIAHDDAAKFEAVEDLLNAADRALYTSKLFGRNRYTVGATHPFATRNP